MVISGVSNTRAATAASAQPAQPVTAAQVKAQLSKFGGDDLGWSMMCPEVVAAWSDVKVMAPALAFVSAMGKKEGYWDRGVRSNKAMMVWLDALVESGRMAMPNEAWLKPMLIASLAMDIGDDGLGRTGHMFLSTGVDGYAPFFQVPSAALDPSLAARAAFIVGCSGKESCGGLYSENVLQRQRAVAHAKQLVTQTADHGQSAKSLSANAKDPAMVRESLDMLDRGLFLADVPACVAAAEAINVVKLGDRARERAEFVGAGSPSTHLMVAQKHQDWSMAVNFLALCAATEAGRN